MKAIVQTVDGVFSVDLETEEVEPTDEGIAPAAQPELSLPRVIAAAMSASTVVAAVARKPPLMLSYDAGATWREAGSGLPPARAVAFLIPRSVPPMHRPAKPAPHDRPEGVDEEQPEKRRWQRDQPTDSASE